MGLPKDDLNALFQLPLDEFTAARNALAARLKKDGRQDEAAGVKGLTRPTVSAWVVNQLFWRHRDLFERLVSTGEQLRRAQASQIAGGGAEMRGPLDARREALSALTRLAAGVLTDAAHNPSPEMLRRITTTLEALSTYGKSPDAPAAGRLTSDVDPPGFEALATLVPASGTNRSKGSRSAILPFQRKTAKEPDGSRGSATASTPPQLEEARAAKRLAAREAARSAERALRDARRAADRAQATVAKAAARVKEAERAKTAAEAQLEAAAAELSEARSAARQIAAEAETAAQVVADAERAAERAQGALETISRDGA